MHVFISDVLKRKQKTKQFFALGIMLHSMTLKQNQFKTNTLDTFDELHVCFSCIKATSVFTQTTKVLRTALNGTWTVG